MGRLVQIIFLAIFSIIALLREVRKARPSKRSLISTKPFNIIDPVPFDPRQMLSEGVKDFSCRNLNGVDFSNQDLTGCNFSNSSLKRAKFCNSNLSFVDMRGADLYRADLTGTNLYVTNFDGCDLTRAVFSGAHLYGVKWYQCDLTRAVFDDILLEEVRSTEEEDFIRAAEIYYKLRMALRQNGIIERSIHYYIRERICRRNAILKRKRFLSWFIDFCFEYLLSGYGESFKNVLIASLVTVLISTISFSVIPIIWPDSYVLDGSVILNPMNAKNIFEVGRMALVIFYFSITTFLSSPPNDFVAIGLTKGIYVLDSLFGVVLTALAITVYLRKIIRE